MTSGSSTSHDLLDPGGGDGPSNLSSTPPGMAYHDCHMTNNDYENESAQNEPCDDAEQQVRKNFEDFKARTAFINNLKELGLAGAKTGEMVRDIRTTNQVLISGCQRLANSLKLVFHDPEARDMMVGKEITIQGKSCVIDETSVGQTFAEAAKAGQKIKTIHLHGIPMEVPGEAVIDFLKSIGLISLYGEKRLRYKEQPDVEGPGRSFVVKYDSKLVILPRYRWDWDVFYKGYVYVKIWFHGQNPYCGKCFQYGHGALECEQFPPLKDTAADLFIKSNQENYEKLCAEIKGKHIDKKEEGDEFAPPSDSLPGELRRGETPWEQFIVEKGNTEGIFKDIPSKTVTCFFFKPPPKRLPL